MIYLKPRMIDKLNECGSLTPLSAHFYCNHFLLGETVKDPEEVTTNLIMKVATQIDYRSSDNIRLSLVSSYIHYRILIKIFPFFYLLNLHETGHVQEEWFCCK